MQRVAYPQPIDGDVLVVSERFVSEHGIFQVAELDEKRIAQCFIGKPLQHVTEDNLFVCLVIEIFSRTVHLTSFDDAGWKHADTFTYGGKQFRNGLVIFGCHNEYGGIPRSFLVDSEQLCGMEGVGAWQVRNLAPTVICSEFEGHCLQT